VAYFALNLDQSKYTPLSLPTGYHILSPLLPWAHGKILKLFFCFGAGPEFFACESNFCFFCFCNLYRCFDTHKISSYFDEKKVSLIDVFRLNKQKWYTLVSNNVMGSSIQNLCFDLEHHPSAVQD
jgi:hypothetical protein